MHTGTLIPRGTRGLEFVVLWYRVQLAETLKVASRARRLRRLPANVMDQSKINFTKVMHGKGQWMKIYDTVIY